MASLKKAIIWCENTIGLEDGKKYFDFRCPHCNAEYSMTIKEKETPEIVCYKCKKPYIISP